MDKKRTFKSILAEVAPDNALALERKARLASWLAKGYLGNAKRLYQIKYAAIGQLFHIRGYNPRIRRAELTPQQDVMLFIRYARSRWLQCALLRQLEQAAPGRWQRWAKTFAHPRSSLTSDGSLPRPPNHRTAGLLNLSRSRRQLECRDREA